MQGITGERRLKMKLFKLGGGIALLILALGSGSSQELLQNPGFEDWTAGMPDYWENETGYFDVVQESGIVHGGNYSAKLILRSTYTQRFIQRVGNIQGGAGYEFSFYVYDNDSMGRARVCIRWYDATGNFISGYYGDYSSDSPDWQWLSSGAQTAPSNAESAHVEIRLYDVGSWQPGDSAVLYVDDASFVVSTPPPPETLTIAEIQGYGDSSPYDGQVVVTYGIVTGVFGNNFFMEEQPGGAWHGIYVYRGPVGDPPVTRGDSIVITAEVDEWYGLTELKNLVEMSVLASGVPIPGPTFLPTGEVPQEQYEGVLVKVDSALCTNDDLGYGEWEVDDGSGPVRIDDMGVSYSPTLDYLYRVTGPLYYSYGNFKIEPRDSSDIVELGPTNVSEKRINSPFNLRISREGESILFSLFLKRKSFVRVVVYDESGRVKEKIFEGFEGRGVTLYRWNPKTSGVYLYSVEAGPLRKKGKIVIVK